MPHYPTKEEILAKEPNIREEVIEITNIWKKSSFSNWKKQTKEQKLENLQTLVLAIATISYNKTPIIITDHNQYCFKPLKKTIYFDSNNPSIISALHELGHFLFGPNELKTCQFSVWIFIKCFPKQYSKLRWQNHLLIK